MPRRSILVASFAAVILLGGSTASAGATVSGPVRPGNKPNAFHAAVDDLKSRGYIEEEFFIEGTTEGKSTPEGALSTPPYKTRLLVRRPADPRRFNGTVVVEWQNVTLGFDFEVGWPMFGELMMREGYAWVGATVQPVGVNFLRTWDPARYGSLAHPGIPPVMPRPAGESGFVVIPGETFSYGIFTEVGIALRRPGQVDPLGGLKVQRVLAYGLSQSAGRLTTYINERPAKDRTYDGYYLHVGPGRVRDDLDFPVFGLNSENEMPRYYQIRKPDSAFYRYWEVPGSGHVPRLASDVLNKQTQRDGAGWAPVCDFGPAVVSIEYASRAALHHLNEWVKSGKQPPQAPFADFDPGRAPANGDAAQPAIRRDKFLNGLGGVRLPHIEVPTGRHIGTGTPPACRLIPGYAPFDAATLASLYPTHESYVSKVKSAAAAAIKAGFLLPADAKAIEAEAAASAANELKVSGLKQPTP
jgi:hypothetical protein